MQAKIEKKKLAGKNIREAEKTLDLLRDELRLKNKRLEALQRSRVSPLYRFRTKIKKLQLDEDILYTHHNINDLQINIEAKQELLAEWKKNRDGK